MIAQSAVIVDVVRSAITTAEADGPISDPSVGSVLTQIFDGLIRRSGVDPNSVDNGVIACGGGTRDWVKTVARDAWRNEGRTKPVTVTGVSADGSQGVHTAMQRLWSDNSQLVIAGGVDCSPTATRTHDQPDQVLEAQAAEIISAKYKLTREQLDDYVARSHRRAAAVADAGEFQDEIVPISIWTPQGRMVIRADTTINSAVTAEYLATLSPLRKRLELSECLPDSQWRITDAHSAHPAAGASAMLISTERRADELQLDPRGRVHAISVPVTGNEPAERLAGQAQQTRAALHHLGIGTDQIDHFEICEASAAIPLAWQAEFDINPAVLNPRGGAISLGHLSGASTARMLTTMLGALDATGGRYGLQISAPRTREATVLIVERF